MAKRSKDWNEGLAEDLRDTEFAREFLLAAMDEGVSVQAALGKVIRAMGVKEFAERVGIASPNVLRAIDPSHNPTQATLNRLLEPFELKLSLVPIDKPKGKHAARPTPGARGRSRAWPGAGARARRKDPAPERPRAASR